MKMKKWLLGCLLLAAVLCLTGMTPKAEASESEKIVKLYCSSCKGYTDCIFIRYSQREYGVEFNPGEHWTVGRCKMCGNEARSSGDPHTGGSETPTCTTGKTCEKCGGQYGILGHDWGDWAPTGDNYQHTRTCKRCSATETEKCSGDSNATCVTLGTCTACGGQYRGVHSFPERWNWRTESRCDSTSHWVPCKYCDEGKAHVDEHRFVPGNEHLKSEATCVSPAVYYKNCGTCLYKNEAETYLDPSNWKDLNNHDIKQYPAQGPTCTEKGWYAYEACQREGCTYTTYEDSEDMRALGHDFTVQEYDVDNHWKKCSRCDAIDGREEHTWDDGKITVRPTCTTAGEKVYTCTECSATKTETLEASGHDLVRHDAQAPTCTEIGWEAYDTCTRCDYTTYTEIAADAKSHDLSHVKAKAPTCTDHGWEAYDVCRRCGYNTIKELPALGHWYGEWTPNGSHTHLASCKRGCGHRAATTCAALDYALPTEGADAYEFTLCPVCGEVSDGALLKLIDQTAAQPITRWLPAGEQVLRLGTLENGEILLTAAFEISGQLTQPTGIVQFTLPAEHLEGMALTILNPDGTEEPLDYTIAGKTATFTLDFTDREPLAMTLHLTPEA